MLNVYTGKLNYSPYAKDTIITFVIPDGKDEHHACLVYWQWGVNGAGEPNVNIKFTGQFRKPVGDHVEIRAYDENYYWFNWSLQHNEAQMMSKTGEECGPPFQLSLVFPVRDEPPLPGYPVALYRWLIVFRTPLRPGRIPYATCVSRAISVTVMNSRQRL